ncbi:MULTISPECIES: alpha/beta fold hydrolase [Halomonadaceae]|uniref:alpha/beta fold hydrolase n=1 Tax=Halomonadaceae TaxID=28256 RepID=UPI0015838066|nr:alpha/beta fold hydrolase [Halomonas sp. BMC7]MDI4636194.1 alpha/beta fold hydrolase [Halomonas sp. BMC7]NUJ60559.1 alpha/beta fold hydrolase [Halomonas taeanensis]
MTRLVLLSGWGIDARIWQPLMTSLPTDIDVSTPDWPGYGTRQGTDTPEDLTTLARAMADDLRQDSLWVGWSLGGLLATALLKHLPAPKSLVLLGMRERFTTLDAARGGVTPSALATFNDAFQHDPLAAWRHFLRWQLSGEPSPRHAHRQLQALIGKEPPATYASLAIGLDWLERLDNTGICASPPCPILTVTGERDPLTAIADPASAHHMSRSIEQAGHCPQLSQPQILAGRLAALAHEHEINLHADTHPLPHGEPPCT